MVHIQVCTLTDAICEHYLSLLPLGPLQVEFLSGVLQRLIQQAGEIEADILNALVELCPCQAGSNREPVFIMWVKYVPTSPSYNHIAPSIPGSSKF